MSDERTVVEALAGFAILLLGGLTGHNYKQVSNLAKEYRSKGDCGEICEAFREQMSEMTKEMRHGFERVYDKLDGKADKGGVN